MSRAKRFLVAVGVVSAVVGLAMIVVPSLASGVATGRPILLLVGVLAGLQGVRAYQARRFATRQEASTADPETRQPLPTPGDDLDELLDRLQGRHTYADRERTAERLERAAVVTVARYEGVPQERAKELLDEGTWTDDRHAASFFSDAVEIGLPTRIRFALTLTPWYGHRATRAAREIARLSEEAT